MFATSSHNVLLPSSGKAKALKRDSGERSVTWIAVSQHHSFRLALTTQPLPPVKRSNHVLITNTYKENND